MRSTDYHRYLGALRFGHVDAIGATVRRRGASEVRETCLPEGTVEITEFAIPATGEVVARRVRAGDRNEYWLRADLDDLAAASLREEDDLHAKIADEVVRRSRADDQRRADDAGLSLGQFRTQRNFRLQRIDQKRGRSSIGMG